MSPGLIAGCSTPFGHDRRGDGRNGKMWSPATAPHSLRRPESACFKALCLVESWGLRWEKWRHDRESSTPTQISLSPLPTIQSLDRPAVDLPTLRRNSPVGAIMYERKATLWERLPCCTIFVPRRDGNDGKCAFCC